MGLKEEMMDGLEEPIPISDNISFLKKGKIRVIMIYEDCSFSEFFCKFPPSYVLNIKKKSYFFVPKCVLKGKYPTIIYFYNNPCPLFLEFQQSKLRAIDTYSDEQLKLLTPAQKVSLSNVFLDSESVNLAFNTTVMRGLYSNSPITVKSLLIILGAVLIVVLVILQLTGTVDVIGALGGGKK